MNIKVYFGCVMLFGLDLIMQQFQMNRLNTIAWVYNWRIWSIGNEILYATLWNEETDTNFYVWLSNKRSLFRWSLGKRKWMPSYRDLLKKKASNYEYQSGNWMCDVIWLIGKSDLFENVGSFLKWRNRY